jgi:ribosomal protein S12 methylthiotransferase accessory factor
MAACRPDALTAAVRVLEEAGSLRLALGWSDQEADWETVLSGMPQPPEAFGLLYAGEDGPARFAFANQNPNVKSELPPCAEGDSPLEWIVGRLAGLGMEVFVVDVTSPEVREFGVVVVKVIVPELMPITFSHSVRYLGHPRLYTAPAKLGYGERTEESVTNDPIPYA